MRENPALHFLTWLDLSGQNKKIEKNREKKGLTQRVYYSVNGSDPFCNTLFDELLKKQGQSQSPRNRRGGTVPIFVRNRENTMFLGKSNPEFNNIADQRLSSKTNVRNLLIIYMLRLLQAELAMKKVAVQLLYYIYIMIYLLMKQLRNRKPRLVKRNSVLKKRKSAVSKQFFAASDKAGRKAGKPMK